MMLTSLLNIAALVIFAHNCDGFSLTVSPVHLGHIGCSERRMVPWHVEATKPKFGKKSLRNRDNRWVKNTSLIQALPDNTLDDTSSSAGVTNATALALEWKRRAQQLKAEATTLELTLEIKKIRKAQQKSTELYNWIKELFIDNRRPLTAELVAHAIQEHRYSEQQILQLINALYEQQAALTRQAAGAIESGVNDDLVNSGVTNSTTLAFIQLLLDASSIVDNDPSRNEQRWPGRVNSKLKARLNELNHREAAERQRQVAVSAVYENTTSPIADNVAMKSDTDRRRKPDSYRVPPWLPGSLALHINSTSPMPLNKTDIQTIQDVILTRTRFFCTSVETIPHAAIFRGNIRLPTSQSGSKKLVEKPLDTSSTLFSELQEELVKEGLADRIRLFFLKDPVWRPSRTTPQASAVVVAIPKKKVALPTTVSNFSVAAYFMSAFSLVAFGIKKYALNPRFYESIVLRHDDSAIFACVPVIIGVFVVQAVHELAHQLAARKHKMRLAFPVPIPSLNFGIVGSITKLRSFPADRRALFDFAMSGPIASFSLSILMMVIGCYQSVNSPLDALQQYPYVLPGEIKASFLASSVLAQCLPRAMNIPLSQPVPLHPLFIAGWTGLIVSALNLMPILRLDGGRAMNAVMGNRVSAIATSWTLLSCISFGPLTGLWAIMMVLVNRKPDLPALNEVSPLPRWRIATFYTAMAAAAMTLLPHPGKLMRL